MAETVGFGIVTYITILLILMTFIIFGNTILIYLLTTKPRIKSISNYYMVSLSASDILIGLFVVSSVIISILKPQDSKFWCIFAPYLELTSFTSGIISLVFISIDRFEAVVHVSRYNPSMKTTYIKIVLSWVIALLYSTRIFIQYHVTDHLKQKVVGNSLDSNATEHHDSISTESEFCNFLHEEDAYDLVFRSIDFVCLFILPMVLISYLYNQIVQKLWSIQIFTTSLQRKRRLNKMLIANIAVFFFCWMPFYLQDIIADSIELTRAPQQDNDGEDEEANEKVVNIVRLIFIVFALSHSFINPVLYYASHSIFRAEVHSLILRCGRSDRATVTPVTENPRVSYLRPVLQAKKDADGTLQVHFKPRDPTS